MGGRWRARAATGRRSASSPAASGRRATIRGHRGGRRPSAGCPGRPAAAGAFVVEDGEREAVPRVHARRCSRRARAGAAPAGEVVTTPRARRRRAVSGRRRTRQAGEPASRGRSSGPWRCRRPRRSRCRPWRPRRSCAGRWSPGRRDRGHVLAGGDVVGAVAVDDPQRVAGAVGDVGAVGRPARQAHRWARAQAPADRAVGGCDRGEGAAGGRADEQPRGGPRGVIPAAEPSPAAVSRDHVQPVGAADQQPPGRRQREVAHRRRRRRGLVDDVAHHPLDRLCRAAVALRDDERDDQRGQRGPDEWRGARRARRRGGAWARTVLRARSRAGPASGGSVSRSARSRAASSSRVIAARLPAPG